ncbi:hypothetical protein [Acetilactobacillus jinshanensis]|uniref:Aggregation promoting factor surface protein n=1 Tax=Acetilactobacillus jinshanensis TaxID=1720083 RepID=A0A4P6ZLC4_9LACO|nr:hypothetical protein [Acetilactobacillus jinshanensis]QBP18478.1 hypothetical protein ELX58_04865 [Acetilactobacillus jinshanensis]URL61349.1 hypothetical protein HGK75_04980 [uncultured bacterium]
MSSLLNKKSSKSFVFYLVYTVLITGLLFIGVSGNIHADTATSHQASNTQYKNQNKTELIQKTTHKAKANKKANNWFNDGLSKRNLKARAWVAWHESRDEWNVLSYGGRCIGYFQMDPAYLGKRHGHVNLNHKHQVKVADAYAKSRYGSWVNAKKFWQAHHWY